MGGGRNGKWIVLSVLSVSFITAAMVTFLLTYYYSHMRFQFFGDFCEKMVEGYPDCKQTVLEVLKLKETHAATSTDKNILLSFGYRQSDFLSINGRIFLLASAGFLIGSALSLLSFWYWHKKSADRIEDLTNYIEKVNTGGRGLLLEASEDEFSRLQDEIYKTIAALYQARDTALKEKNKFANNLSNIAHQLKPPITAISLFLWE